MAVVVTMEIATDSRRRQPLAGMIRSGATPSGSRFVVYAPPADDRGRNQTMPVLYHLHGAMIRWNWVEQDVRWIAAQQELAVDEGIGRPTVIVAPYDPSGLSMWADDAAAVNRAATMLLDDVMPFIESTHSVGTDRCWRLIQGFSMGGFGAAALAFKHQDLFAAAAIWDGALHDWSTLSANRRAIAARQFSNNARYFERWSPWSLAAEADTRTPVFLVAGLLTDFAERYARHLGALRANVTYVSGPAVHDFRVLQESFGRQSFDFFASALEKASLSALG